MPALLLQIPQVGDVQIMQCHIRNLIAFEVMSSDEEDSDGDRAKAGKRGEKQGSTKSPYLRRNTHKIHNLEEKIPGPSLFAALAAATDLRIFSSDTAQAAISCVWWNGVYRVDLLHSLLTLWSLVVAESGRL